MKVFLKISLFSSFLLLLFVFPPTALAATLALDWTRQFGSAGDDLAQTVDASGNVYVAGFTDGALSGQTNLGFQDAFLVKYDSSGNSIWTRQFGTAFPDAASGLALDGTGIYVSGQTGGAFSGETSFGQADVFLRKYDFDGNVLWTRQFGTADNDINRGGVAADATGIYVAGIISADAFAAKYDANGNLLWTKQFGTAENDAVFGMTIWSSAVYLGGETEGAFSGQTSYGGGDAFVGKLNATDGAILWVRQLGTALYDEVKAVAAETSGVYIGGFTESAFPGKSNPSGGDAFIAKYDHSGNQLWLQQLGTNLDVEITRVYLDNLRVFAVGQVDGVLPGQTALGSGDAFVLTYDVAGTSLWLEQFGTAGFDKATAVSLDYPAIYVAGYTVGAFSGQTSSGKGDAFLRKYLYLDFDNDDIYDTVDAQYAVYSNNFSDVGIGGATAGTITGRGGQILTIQDAVNPSQGVLVSASSSGSGQPAKISACGDAAKYTLNAGNQVTITCGSATTEVFSGPVEIILISSVDGRTADVSLGEGYELTFYPDDFSFVAPEANPDSVIIAVNGDSFALAPGETVIAKNHGLYVSSQDDKKTAALSGIGMPEKSRKP